MIKIGNKYQHKLDKELFVIVDKIITNPKNSEAPLLIEGTYISKYGSHGHVIISSDYLIY